MEQYREVLMLLRTAGLKSTAPRRALLAALMRAARPLSIANVLKELGRASVDTVTAYRALRAFEKAGLVRRVDLGHRHAHYELVGAQGDRHHVVCLSCGTTEPFEGCDAAHLVKEALAQVRGFRTVTGHSLALYGLCNTCAVVNK
jgi:Fe2+ or Zn2+ uptake regulation protein